MNKEFHDDVMQFTAKTFLWVVAWLGSITAAEVQTWIGILSGAIVGGLAATNWFILWRDKIQRDRWREESKVTET